MDKYVVACFDEGVAEFLYEGVAEFLDKNNKDDFDDNSLLAHPLVYLLEGALGGQYIVHHGFIKKIFWSDTYVHLSFYH